MDTTARFSAAASSAAPKPVSEHSADATPTESDLIPYNEAEQRPINFSNHFKKSKLGQKVIRTLVHPLYTKEKKFDFLNRHVPVDTISKPMETVDEGAMSALSDREAEKERKERENLRRIAYEQKVDAEKEARRKAMKAIIKKVDETAKQREAKQKSIQR